MNKCPYCDGDIQDGAKKCKHCREWLTVFGVDSTNDKDNVMDSESCSTTGPSLGRIFKLLAIVLASIYLIAGGLSGTISHAYLLSFSIGALYVASAFYSKKAYGFKVVNKTKGVSVGFRIIAATLLLLAIEEQSDDYYTILRWIVSPACFYSSVLAYRQRKEKWVWFLIIIGLFFNPLKPVHLDAETWYAVNIIVGVILLASTYFVYEKELHSDTNQ
jgi:hypothetical protein